MSLQLRYETRNSVTAHYILLLLLTFFIECSVYFVQSPVRCATSCLNVPQELGLFLSRQKFEFPSGTRMMCGDQK